jgi:hypothetical protein
MANKNPVDQIHEYACLHGLTIGSRLGFGVHGSVFAAENQSNDDVVAIKAFESEECYVRERDVYLRLKELRMRSVHGCTIPTMTGFDDGLRVIEMTVVARPFVLDFAGAYLDRAPEFSEEALAEWRAEKQEQFGARWGDVQIILANLAGHGIFVVDVNPNNISWGD